MQTNHATNSSGLTARLFQHLRVGGETLLNPQQAGQSRAPRLGEAVNSGHRSGLLRNVEPTASALQPAKAKTSEQDQTTSATASFSYRRSERTTLFLTTQQGDTVQLKIKNQTSTDAAYSELESGETLLSQFSLQSKDASKMSLVVKGDLNADELRAIRSVVEQVSVMAQDFFAGNVADAFATAERFNMDGDQLADVAVGMRFEEQLTYTQTTAAPLLTQARSDVPENIQAEPNPLIPAASDRPLAPVPSPTRPLAPTPAKTNALQASEPPGALNSRAQIMQEALNVVGEFLKGLLNNLQQAAPAEEASDAQPMGVALKIKIFKSVLTAAHTSEAPAKSAPAPLPALVGDTLDALSAKHELPLNTVI